ncbi:mannose-1-phosphate guanylyltransferase/mannose-6-phosphate isomerase [Klebsiella sp. R390]|uniref:mannose-1-phosphate guanylyltransferase/mannose-6-phosphate isomerase n=1 Tax=Klebsiella sp. R390 TaxID=2755400 RepID=UPI003DA946F9
MILPVIMAGGTGSRLWPMSRELFPKQFLKLTGENSMLQETLLRLDGLDVINPMLICNEQHRFLAAEQLRQINKLSNNIILEPVGRNTAPAIALAAFCAMKNGEDPLLLVLAADHVIENKDAFHRAVESAIPFAQNGNLATFGIVPAGPETGYGYIHRGNALVKDTNTAFTVKGFVEKPDMATAISYLESGEFYWNSGMFLFKASTFLSELRRYRPDIYEVCESSVQELHFDKIVDFIRIDKEIFTSCPDESVDYAVMEKTQHAVVIPLDAGWNDVGSWSALWEVNPKDSHQNCISGDIFTHNTNNCYINTDEALVAAIGVENLVIINTKDATLVINKDKVQDVKKVVEYLKGNDRKEYRLHRENYRPWGLQDKIVTQPRYHINRITINPGAKLSLQRHLHRAEHWVVLSGTAKVSLDGNEFLLTENQSTFIPSGSEHMLMNPGKITLEILEIASGSYLGDDDVIRVTDHYKN